MIFFYLLVTVMPLMRHPLWSAFVGDLTMIKYLGSACVVYALFYVSQRRTRLRLFHTSQERWFLALAGWATLSYLTMGAPGRFEESYVLSYLSFLLLLFVTLVVVDSQRRIRWVLLAAIASMAFASLHVIREWQKYDVLRPGWAVGDANYYSISAVLCLPIAVCLLRERRPAWQRWFCLISLAVILFGFALAASRGGLLGLGASLLYLTIRSSRRRRDLAVLLALSIPLMLAAPASPIRRLLTPNPSDVQAAEIRESLWWTGLGMVLDHPLTGVGLGNFKPSVRKYATSEEQGPGIAHNTYVEIAAELGVPALVAFAAILLCSFRTLETVRRRALASGSFLLHAALGLQAGLVGYAVSALFVSAQYQKLFWLIVFLTPALLALSRTRTPRGPARKASSQLQHDLTPSTTPSGAGA